ncbi:tRNA (guanine(46)-N(7))-methyltransferase TrmB [Aureimonas leprariae]|uniref:tRNA (guanine-N(7)-)-methyltransferase n=1 Tax=Plantimonas leprariae TaxID=2615207 RepID=A0A7V7PT45_9HYPH|nr:tRNA (guanine(46)-N(7))-methyltransferase TrmB [Aureimonas leprariae]KAB0682849.1 tRNA (guanosine(46)-N7)-methyltransferase TrmB [Aureimonas leprariae]
MTTAEENERPRRRREAFFGRVMGKALTERQADLFETLLPGLAIDLGMPPPRDLRSLFETAVEAVRLEIGFGGGEHLLAEADRHPQVGFIGAEAFRNGLAKMLTSLDERARPNLRLHADDATLLLDWLPAGAMVGVDLFYPDPWPKRKHWKRRFVSPRNLDRLARAIRPGGLFRFASDIDTYVDWTLQHIHAHGGFEWTARRADDWRRPFEGWPGTRYEAKAIREGRTPAYLTFRRRDEA